MRLKDSSMYLWLSILSLCRISLILHFLTVLGTATPGIVISLPQAGTVPDIPTQNHINKNNNNSPYLSKPAPAGSDKHLLLPDTYAHIRPKVGDSDSSFYSHSSSDAEGIEAYVISAGYAGDASVPAVAPPSPTLGNKKKMKRVLDNHTGRIVRPPQPDFQPTSLALLTTIDGALHCINTANGDVMWTREPTAVGAIVSSNITKYTRSTRSADPVDILSGGHLGGGGQLDGGKGDADGEGEARYNSEDWTFIVEPSEIPSLYLHSSTSGLQYVGSLTHLVSKSPQIRPDGKRITGGKKTSLLELEISRGDVIEMFEAEGGCTGPEGIKGKGPTTFVLGHAEYTLCIVDQASGMQWDISYSEYFPVTDDNLDINRPVTWIGSNKDGVAALWSPAGIMWRTRLASPTTSVLEVFMNSKTLSAVLVRQRRPAGMETPPSRAYIGTYQDQLYVLSEENYPMLGKTDLEMARGPYLGIEAQEDDDKEKEDGEESRTDCRAGSPHYPRCLVGPHMIGLPFQSEGFLMVGDGSGADSSHAQDKLEGAKSQQKEQESDQSKTFDPFGPPRQISTTTTVVGWLVIFVGILTAVVYSKGIAYLIKPVDSFLEDHNVQFRMQSVAKAVTQGVVGVSTAVVTASSMLGVGRGSLNNHDGLPEFNKSSTSTMRTEMGPLISDLTMEEKTAARIQDLDQKTENGTDNNGKKGPRGKAPEQRNGEEANGANGAGVGNGNGGGGRKKKRGAGGKGQKAAAAAAAAAAAVAANGEEELAENGTRPGSEKKETAAPSKTVSKDANSAGENGWNSSSTEAGSNNSQEMDGQQLSALRLAKPASNAPLLKSIQVSDTVLGYGSHGTVVYKGTYDGRPVAVKRLLIDFYDVAFHEVRLLQESDDHLNVVRYFRSEQCDRFLYIALELCSASLDDIIERGRIQPFRDLSATLEPQKILYQIISGIHHLHSLKIVHRDIKPQNILIGEPKRRPKPSRSALSSTSSLSATPSPPPLGSSGMITSVVRHNSTPAFSPAVDLYPGRVLISDFGLCRKLENDQSSFHNTTAHGGRGGGGGGTIGWRAPECFSGVDQEADERWTIVNGGVAEESPSSSSSSQGAGVGGPSSGRANRMTRAIDIFSAGCVFYYVLTNGDHPFGDRYSRERNILLDQPNLDALKSMGEEGVEAMDLISKMIAHDPADRPDAFTVMHHPFFWSANKRLMFMQDCSDRFEVEDRGPNGVSLELRMRSPLLRKLEHNAMDILGKDWYTIIDKNLVDNLESYRKYDGTSVRDLLRALRNKKHHYQDLPPKVKRALGELPLGFLTYFTSRFPKLMLHLYYIVADDPGLRNESMFKHYFID